jgi:serine/threonine protein kinase
LLTNFSPLHALTLLPATLLQSKNAIFINSSAKDQLMGTSVAIKKIMKPFSTPVLAKRTYRELKLLKHIQHENVGSFPLFSCFSRSIFCHSSRLPFTSTIVKRSGIMCRVAGCGIGSPYLSAISPFSPVPLSISFFSKRVDTGHFRLWNLLLSSTC